MAARLHLFAVLFSVILAGCVSTGDSPPKVDDAEVVTSYINLAKGYVQEGFSERALKPLRRALEVQPRSAEAHGVLGLVYQVQGETALAEASFRRALSLDPDSGELNNNFGAFLFSLDRLDEAYSRFFQASEDLNYESRSRTFENLGVVSLRQDKPQLAIEHFQKALRLNGSLPLARLELSELLFDQGQARDAWSHYQIFTQLSRQNERSLELGVRLAKANGDHSAAANYTLQLERQYRSFQ